MKRILFFILTLVSINSFGQLIQFPSAKGFGWANVGADSCLWIPSDTIRPSNQIINRTLLARKGTTLYYWNGSRFVSASGGGSTITSLGTGFPIGITGTNNTRTINGSSWITLDSTTTSNVVTINNNGLFGKAGNDVRATAARNFSFATNAWVLDSIGDTRLTLRNTNRLSIQAVSTDSAGLIVQRSGVAPVTLTAKLVANATNTGLVSTVQVRRPTTSFSDVQISTIGGVRSINSLAQFDSTQIALSYHIGTTPEVISYVFLKEDSIMLWHVQNNENSELKLMQGAADQWADNRLSWRTTDSTSKIVLKKGFGYFYGDDSLFFESDLGYYRFANLLTGTTSDRVALFDANGKLKQIAMSSIAPALSSLTAATGTNSINNADNPQTWAWNTLSSNTGLLLNSTSTAASSSTQVLFKANLTGANVNAGEITTTADIRNTHTGSGTNIGLKLISTSGSTNYSLDATGQARFNTGINFNGSTSDLQLNGSAGTTDQELVSAGSGNTPTWKSAGDSTYLPTLTNVTNAASSSVSGGSFKYIRRGSEVMVSGVFTVTPTANTSVTQVAFSLPIASNFLVSQDATGNCTAVGSTYNAGIANADATNDRIQVEFISSSTSAHTIYFNAMYTIK